MRPIDLDPGEAILHEGDAERCVVLLPGVRYFSQAPLLWFAREAAQAEGWSVLEVSERAPGGRGPVRVAVRAGGERLAAASAEQVALSASRWPASPLRSPPSVRFPRSG